jgi:multiple sugar transport system substrate-binding protein/putative aldouronate transport system substrate-binding protein
MQTWQDCLAEGGFYLRCLRFYNQLFQRGLLDPDSMTQGADGAAEDYISGGAFFNIFTFAGAMQYNTEEHLNEGKAMYPIIMEDQKTLMSGLNVFGGSRVITIGANTQYPELCMEIINWLSTPEGKMVTTYGPKGVTWDYDENEKSYLTELGLKTVADGDTEMTDGYAGTYKDGVNAINFETWNMDATNPDANGETYNYESWASYNESLKHDILDEWREFTGFTTQDEYMNSKNKAVTVGTNYSETKRSDELELKWEQSSKNICDYSWKAIYARDDDEYDKIVKEMKEVVLSYGYEELCDFYRAEADRRKAAEDLIIN